MAVIREPQPTGHLPDGTEKKLGPDLGAEKLAPYLQPGERFYTNALRLNPGEIDSEVRDRSAEGIYKQLTAQPEKYLSVRLIDTAFARNGDPLETDQAIVVIDNPQYKQQ